MNPVKLFKSPMNGNTRISVDLLSSVEPGPQPAGTTGKGQGTRIHLIWSLEDGGGSGGLPRCKHICVQALRSHWSTGRDRCCVLCGNPSILIVEAILGS